MEVDVHENSFNILPLKNIENPSQKYVITKLRWKKFYFNDS